jgi:hypothetical protein
MSGPIIRRYGFPNFEKIFGDRPIEHGIEEEDDSKTQSERPGSRESKSEETAPEQGAKTKKPSGS